LTNDADPNAARIRGTMLVAMAAMFVGALAVPQAFGRHGVVFGVAFPLVCRLIVIIAIGESRLSSAFSSQRRSGLHTSTSSRSA
jgi:low temperature requirement protein LtrA